MTTARKSLSYVSRPREKSSRKLGMWKQGVKCHSCVDEISLILANDGIDSHNRCTNIAVFAPSHDPGTAPKRIYGGIMMTNSLPWAVVKKVHRAKHLSQEASECRSEDAVRSARAARADMAIPATPAD